MSAPDLPALVDTAARATVAAFSDAEDTGDGVADLAWMLGGAVTYKEGLARFAAEVIRAAAEARPTAEEAAAAVLADNYGDPTPGALDPLDALASAIRETSEDAHADMRDALDAFRDASERSANLGADAIDADDVLNADHIYEEAARAFAPVAARWIAARLGVKR